MKPDLQTLTPQKLFETTVRSPGDDDLLRQVEKRADEVIAALDSPDAVNISDEELGNLDPLWVARVYEALAGTAEAAQIAPEVNDELYYAHADAEYQIGVAYKETLIPGLPEDLADLAGRWLVKVSPVDEDEMRDALMSPAARGAYPLSEPLAQYGVTPLTVFDATESVSRLLDRLMRRGRLDPNTSVTLSGKGIQSGDLINEQLLVNEISRVAVCREPTAYVLYKWSRCVAQFKPLLFSGFQAEPAAGDSVVLVRTGEKVNNLFQRWGLSLSYIR